MRHSKLVSFLVTDTILHHTRRGLRLCPAKAQHNPKPNLSYIRLEKGATLSRGTRYPWKVQFHAIESGVIHFLETNLLSSLLFLKMHVSYLAGVVPLLSLAAAGLIARDDDDSACHRDNVFRCILGASATGSAYCSSFLSYGTVTSYTSTVTPTVYVLIQISRLLIGS